MSRAMPFPTLWLVLPIKNQMNITSLQMDGRTASRPWIRSDEVGENVVMRMGTQQQIPPI